MATFQVVQNAADKKHFQWLASGSIAKVAYGVGRRDRSWLRIDQRPVSDGFGLLLSRLLCSYRHDRGESTSLYVLEYWRRKR